MRKRRKRSRAEWKELVAAWRASGLSQQEFAKEKGLASTTLSWWACRLRREGGDPAPSLVPVEVVREDAAEPVGAAPLRVELSRGRTIVVPPDFDAPTLRRLVTTLEDGAC